MSDEENLDLEELKEETPPPEDGADKAESKTASDDDSEGSDEDNADEIISGLEAVYDIPVQVSAVLGRASMQVSQLLKLGRGAVVELDRKVGEAIDIYVNDRLVARGEVVVLDERLGITMTEIIKSDRH